MKEQDATDKTETRTLGVRASQVLSAALAAVTAAVLGSTMGVAGTVLGAGLGSVVTTVAGALYLRSIEQTRQRVQTVRAKVVSRSGVTTLLTVTGRPGDQTAEAEPMLEAAENAQPSTGPGTTRSDRTGSDTAGSDTAGSETARNPHRRPRWLVLVAGSVLAFALGMLVITGVEWIRGEQLSGGTGTTFGGIVQSGGGAGEQNDPQAPAPVPTSTPEVPSVPSDPTDAPPVTSEDADVTSAPSAPSGPPTTEPPTTTAQPPTTEPTIPPGPPAP